MNRFAIAVAVVGIVGCGGSSSGGVSFTIRGQSFTAVETISAVQTTSGTTFGVVALSGRSGSCALAASNTNPKNTKILVIAVTDNFAAATTGAFTVAATSGKLASVKFISYDATCGDISAQEAMGVSGTITLTSVSGNALAGTYDITFDSTDHITGSFTGTACAGVNLTGTSTTCG